MITKHQMSIKNNLLITITSIKIGLPELVLPATMPNNSGTATIPLIGSGIFKGKLHPLQIPSAAPSIDLATLHQRKARLIAKGYNQNYIKSKLRINLSQIYANMYHQALCNEE